MMAEAVRFELTDGFPSPVFKTGALNHSATLPAQALEVVVLTRSATTSMVHFEGADYSIDFASSKALISAMSTRSVPGAGTALVDQFRFGSELALVFFVCFWSASVALEQRNGFDV